MASIRQIHPNPYRLSSPSDFEATVAAVKERLPSLSPPAIVLEMQRILAMTGDGHTEWAELPALLRGNWLRLIFRRFEEGWFIRTGDPAYQSLFGKPIVRLAGIPIQEAVLSVLPYVSGDGCGSFGTTACRLKAVS